MLSRAPRQSCHRSPAESAFTLIELLVVIVIVGIVSAVALLSFGILGDDRDLQKEARRLSSLIELANDEATLQGREYGLEFVQSGYRFVEHDPLTEQWFEVIGDEILRPRTLSEETEFDLYLEDRRILLDIEATDIEVEEDDADEDDLYARNPRDRDLTDDYAPHVMIMSSGDISPFELSLIRRTDQAKITITMSPAGEIEITNENQQDF